MKSPQEIFDAVEAEYKHVVYDPKADKIWLVTSAYRCLDTRATWCDAADGVMPKGNNPKRIRLSKLAKMEYVCRK